MTSYKILKQTLLVIIFVNLPIASMANDGKDPRVEIRELASIAKSCTLDTQCKVIEYGYDSCGNYSNNAAGYLTYSEKTDSKVIERIKELARQLRKYGVEASKKPINKDLPLSYLAIKMCQPDIRDMHISKCIEQTCTIGRWRNEI
jgi:hypothetical protein